MVGTAGNNYRFNQHVAVLPFIEQQAIYNAFASTDQSPWNTLGQTMITAFHCPSDGNARLPGRTDGGGSARSNIVISFGDAVNTDHHARGFVARRNNQGGADGNRNNTIWRTFASLTDGSSNTVLCSEAVGLQVIQNGGDAPLRGGIWNAGSILGGSGNSEFRPSECMNGARSDNNRNMIRNNANTFRTGRQFDVWQTYVTFTTILPPNAPACQTGNGDDNWGFFPPQSNHPGGVNVGFADGAVRFIPDSINTGGLPDWDWTRTIGPSPYGVWGALGSINGGESVTL